MIALAEGVAGVGIAELGHRADVAGAQPLDLDPLLALLDREVVQLLGHLVLGVPDLVAVRELAIVEAEQGHVAHVGLGDGLEDAAQERRVAPAACSSAGDGSSSTIFLSSVRTP